MTMTKPRAFIARQAPAFQGGDGLPVVALHSSASTGSQWCKLAETFAGRRRVVTPDLPGYGSASVATEGPASLADEAEAVARSLGASAPAFHLVGHSYGGAVALKIALNHPRRVRSLTLIEPVVFHLLTQGGETEVTDMRLYRGVLGVRDRLRGAVAAGWPAHGMAAFVDFWNGPGAWEQLDVGQRQKLAAHGPAVVRNFKAVLGETWPLVEAARLTMPLLTISGETSPEVTLRLTDKLINTARDVTAARVFGAGHMVPLTHAVAVNSLIERHIRRIEKTEDSAQRYGGFLRPPAAA